MEAGKQLRAWRKAEKLTQDDAGVRFEVTGHYIGLLERGERTPALAFANLLKRVCGIPTEAWEAPAKPEDPPAPAGDGDTKGE